jgi:hypothetical protein
LYENHVKEWTDMPLWLDGDHFSYDNQRLKNDFNFQFTDFEQSIKETILYYDSLGWKEPIYGMSEKTKIALLNKLRFLPSQE